MRSVRTVLAAATISLLPLSTAIASEDVVVVYDASGSMWGQIDGVSKIEIAREAMADLVSGWSDDTNIGLVAYGHRRQGDCGDIETLIEPQKIDRDSFIATVNAIRPNGKTPISASVQHAADLLSYRDNPATVVLISDGLETCQGDPCALAADLARQGVKFTAHVIGFDLDDEAHKSLACIAENSGGVFVPAGNASELKDALTQVQSVLDLQPVEQAEATSEPEPEPEPEPEKPALPEIGLTAPEQVITGAIFDFSWTGTIHKDDFITIVPTDAEEGTVNTHIRARDNDKGRLTAPGETGLYELRYVLNEGRRTVGSTPVEVVEGEVSISGPEQVTTGAAFDFSWTGTIHKDDFITIVPTDADEGTVNTHIRARDNDKGRLTAPGETGLYELRYVLNEGRHTLASTPVEVVEGEVSISGPEQVTTGATFDVSWAGGINKDDFVTIVPANADEGTVNTHIRARDNDKGRLTAPGETGLYELRYVLNEGRHTLATAPIEVVESEVSLTGPDEVVTGADFSFSWTGTINKDDFITIVPAGADEGTVDNHIRAREDDKGRLTAPGETGLYELRYVLNEGRHTLASIPIEVVEGEIGIAGPGTVRAGTDFDFSWAGAINKNDYITIVPASAEEGTVDSHIRVRESDKGRMTAPVETGLYELRYVLNENRRTMASTPLEVVAADAPLDDGAGLDAPAEAQAGETITITWSGGTEGSDQRISLARANQPDFSWVSVHPAGAEKTLDLVLPKEPGRYEIRFLDIGKREVLGRSILEVK